MSRDPQTTSRLAHYIAIWDFLDELRERRYLFWRRWLGKFTQEPIYLWNGGWND
jgi:hypothetical protein